MRRERVEIGGAGRAVLSLAIVAGLGCVERHPVRDPSEAQGQPDRGFDAIVIDMSAPNASPDRGLDRSVPDAMPDAMPPDAMPDAAPPDCSLPSPPAVVCEPDQLGTFEALPLDTLAPVLWAEDAEPGHVVLADRCEIRPAQQYDIGSEAAFQDILRCADGVERRPSTVDWSTDRLVLIGMVPNSSLAWSVVAEGVLRFGIEVQPDCRGAPMASRMVGFLLPAALPPLGEPVLCIQELGPQGCCSCEVICDPTPRLGECVCPP